MDEVGTVVEPSLKDPRLIPSCSQGPSLHINIKFKHFYHFRPGKTFRILLKQLIDMLPSNT